MALFSTIALATRGRILPAGVRKTLAIASLGWILIGGVIPPTPPSPYVERAKSIVGGRYNGEKELLDLLMKEDDEVLHILKSWVQCL